MRSDREFDIGRAGIDTPYERDIINYSPTVEYDPERDGDGSFSLVEGPPINEPPVSESAALDAWRDYQSVREQTNELIEKLEEKLKDIEIPTPHDKRDKLIKAGEILGFDLSQKITFDAYRATFDLNGHAAHELVQTVFESYMADIDGHINAELYRDVREIQMDWDQLDDFIQRGLLGQILTAEQRVERELISGHLQKSEKAAAEAHRTLLRLHAVNREIYMRMAREAEGTEAYYDALTQYDDTERERLSMEKRIFTRVETAEIIRSKASDAEDLLNLIDSAIDHDPYEGEDHRMLYYTLKQFRTNDEAVQKLSRMRLMLKLAVDSKNRQGEAETQRLRQVSGLQNKLKIQQSLINDIHLRNHVTVDMFDMMGNMNGVPNDGNFEVMMNHVGEGVVESEKVYKMHLNDFYRIHGMDESLRSDRLVNVVDKDITRNTYKMIDGVVKYIETSAVSWPEPKDMNGWISNYMAQHQSKGGY